MITPEALKAARSSLSLSQAQLSDALGVTENTLWRYESGRLSIPSLLANALVGWTFLSRGHVAACEVADVLGIDCVEHGHAPHPA